MGVWSNKVDYGCQILTLLLLGWRQTRAGEVMFMVEIFSRAGFCVLCGGADPNQFHGHKTPLTKWWEFSARMKVESEEECENPEKGTLGVNGCHY